MKLVLVIVPIILIVLISSANALTNAESNKFIFDGAQVHPCDNVTRVVAFIAYHDAGYDAVVPNMTHMYDLISLFSPEDLPRVYLKGLTPVVNHGKPAGFLPAPCFVPDGGIQRTLDDEGHVVSVHALTRIKGKLTVVDLDKDTGEIISKVASKPAS